MIPLKEQVTIDAPPDVVWPLLSDPVQVAQCLPGATLVADKGDGAYEGTLRVKFGPTVVNFRGEVSLLYDHAARRCTINGRGIDQRGAARALAAGTVTVAGERTSTVSIEGEYHLTGPLEAFARTGGVHLARALMSEFARNIAHALAEAAPPPEARPKPPDPPSATSASATSASTPAAPQQPSGPRPAPALSAGRLLWLGLRHWLRNLFKITGQERKP